MLLFTAKEKFLISAYIDTEMFFILRFAVSCANIVFATYSRSKFYDNLENQPNTRGISIPALQYNVFIHMCISFHKSVIHLNSQLPVEGGVSLLHMSFQLSTADGGWRPPHFTSSKSQHHRGGCPPHLTNHVECASAVKPNWLPLLYASTA